MKPTDEQIVERLAGFCGWKKRTVKFARYGKVNCEWYEYKGDKYMHLPDFLNSRDALEPVLEKLTEFQKAELMFALAKLSVGPCPWQAHFFFLTIPPRTIASALYEVI